MALFKSFTSKLRKGLEKTRAVLAMDVMDLLRGRRLDEALIAQVHKRLIQADVGVKTASRLMDTIRDDFRAGRITRGDEVLDYLKRELAAMWPHEDRALRSAEPGTPTVILVTGVNGAGKTTSIAKLCQLLRSQDKRVLLGACDTFRAGAVRQLEVWAQRLGVEVVKGQQGGDPAAVAFDAVNAGIARGMDVVILDTAGRLQTQDPLMRQLAKIRSVAAKRLPGAPHEVLLVLDATAGQNALRQAEEFSKALAATPDSPGITGIFLAKLDGTAKGGIVVAIREAINIPVKFIGVGETPEDVEPFDPAAFVEALFAE
ncbi:MAG: signal recognition particle-docking protein FtsY [Phycisphaerales bacterium]